MLVVRSFSLTAAADFRKVHGLERADNRYVMLTIASRSQLLVMLQFLVCFFKILLFGGANYSQRLVFPT